MNVADILKQFADSPTDTNADFDAVARQVPAEVPGHGIAQAMRSDQKVWPSSVARGCVGRRSSTSQTQA